MNVQVRNYLAWVEKRTEQFDDDAPDSIGELLARRARSLGDTIAIDFFEQGEKLSYRDLDQQVSQLANGFRQIGIGYQTHVAVMLPNRIEYAVTWLALARLGAVMVPVNPAYKTGEMEHQFSSADVAFMVTESDQLVKLDVKSECLANIRRDSLIIVGESREHQGHSWQALLNSGAVNFTPKTDIQRTDLLNIQFTSGTTGFPKGCMQTHEFWLCCGFNQVPKDIPPFKSSLGEAPFFYFDGLNNLIKMLYAGGTVFQAARYSSSRILDRLRQTRAECAFLPVMLDDIGSEFTDHNVRLFTGYRLDARLVKKVEALFGSTVREGYGMTEIGSPLRTPLDITDEAVFGTCGLPTPSYQLKIVDPNTGRDAPQGQPGELLVRGRGIMKGYYKNPEANSRAFLGEWFRTGDIFEQTDEGYYRIVGRIKEMIKRSGENISANEVEKAIRQFPGVQGVVVVAVPSNRRSEEVKAFVQLRDDVEPTPVTAAEIRTHCEKLIATFKCPRFIRFIKEFPYLGSGKIARAQLAKDESLRAGCWDYTTGTIL